MAPTGLAALLGIGDLGERGDETTLARQALLWQWMLRESAINNVDGVTAEVEDGDTGQDLQVDRFVWMLRQTLRCLGRVNNASRESTAQRQQDEESVRLADDCIGFALAQLVARWFEQSGDDSVASGQDSTSARTLCVAVVINELVQLCDIGHTVPSHDHALVASCASRVFESGSDGQPQCAQCGQALQFAVDSLAALSVEHARHIIKQFPVVYRCALCRYHLCCACFDSAQGCQAPGQTWNVVVASAGKTVERDARHLTSQSQVDRFFSLMLPFLEKGSEHFNAIARGLATELRRRVFEVVIYRAKDIAPLTKMFLEMVRYPSVPLLLVLPADPQTSSPSNIVVSWLPPSVVKWKMPMLSFLGPFLWATTCSNEFVSRNNGRNPEVVDLEASRHDWDQNYDHGLRLYFMNIMQCLLLDTQDPLVVEATVSWLGTVVTSVNLRRQRNPDADDGLNGFLINVSCVLSSMAIQALESTSEADKHKLINPEYHQVSVSIRAFGDKDNPEVPLRALSSSARNARMEAEADRLRELDRLSIDEYRNPSHGNGPSGCTYYPAMKSNYGVCCDRCRTPNFNGPRYKCAFCEDSDLCQQCFRVFAEQPVAKSRTQGCDAPGSISQSVITREAASDAAIHNPDHVYLRVSVPVPLCDAMHFEWKNFDKSQMSYNCVGGVNAAPSRESCPSLRCGDCGCLLDNVDILYKCSNCFDPRFVCGRCLALEERLNDPHKFHAPGHLYFSLTKGWRELYSPLATVLHFRSLSHLAPLVPRVRFGQASDYFHLALKCMHHGPLLTIQRYLLLFKEAQELKAFCFCEEEKLDLERLMRRSGLGGQLATVEDDQQRTEPLRRRPTAMSSYYESSKSRLTDMKTVLASMEIHLLNPRNVANWVTLYSRTCSWLLDLASSSQNGYGEVLTQPSAAFCAFPEHFVFDLCDLAYFLGLRRVPGDALVPLWTAKTADPLAVEEELLKLLEPVVVLLLQIIISPECSSNLRLRSRALLVFPSLLSFFLSSACGSVVEDVFDRNRLLMSAVFPGLIRFHDIIERAEDDSSGSDGDETVNGIDYDLPSIRAAIAVVLQLLWRVPSQQRVMEKLLCDDDNMGQYQSLFSVLADGVWRDLTKLVEDADNKLAALYQLRNLLESSDHGQNASLPIRPEMMDGYIALHTKQLQQSFRAIIEMLEWSVWMTESLSMHQVLGQSCMVERCVRTVGFLASHVVHAHESGSWELSEHILVDGRVLLAHLIFFVLRCVSPQWEVDSARTYHMLVRTSGDAMVNRIADLDSHVRWYVQAAILQLDSRRRSVEGPAAQKHQAHDSRRVRFRKRFVSQLVKDGRFDCDRFINSCEVLRTSESTGPNIYEHVDSESMRELAVLMAEGKRNIALIAELDALFSGAPDEYLDPLMGGLMIHPVRLPSSGKVVDYSVIERHLQAFRGTPGTDPFTREHLVVDMVSPCNELSQEIRAYVLTKICEMVPESMEDALIALGFSDDELHSMVQEIGLLTAGGTKRSYAMMSLQ